VHQLHHIHVHIHVHIHILIHSYCLAPQAIGNVYREKVFRDSNVKMLPNYLNFWLSIFQFLVTIPMLPFTFYYAGIPLSHVGGNFYEGTRCWLTGKSGTSWDCSKAPIALNIFLVANITSHVFQVLTVCYEISYLLLLFANLPSVY
jgi:hypothetical protein